MSVQDIWIVLVVIAIVGVATGFWLIRRITSDADEPRSFWRYRRKL